MLGVGILPPPSAPPLYAKPATSNNPIYFSLLLQRKTQKKALFFCPQVQHTLSSSFLLERTGFCLFAQKKQKNSSFSRIELERQDFEVDEEDYEELDEGFDDNEFDEDSEDYDDEDDDDELMLPFDKMDAWLKKKPKGFGEGKLYDTSLEDKLLEELEKSRKAQLANIEKLKNEAREPKNELKKEVKVSEDVPGAIRVRINNLPKKKNIHRDLKSAFSGVHGIINILPIVSGTKKTRDLVCKGFAFVDFKSVKDANRFVQLFSGQNIAFGKTEKRIKCEVLKSQDASSEDSLHDRYNSSGSEEEGLQSDDIVENVHQSGSWDEDYDELAEDSHDTDVTGNHKLSSLMEQDDFSDGAESRMSQSLDSSSTKPKEKKAAVNKKSVGIKKPDNNPKLNIPGSAKRLKIQDKAKLADVFSRYGSRQAVASKEM